MIAAVKHYRHCWVTLALVVILMLPSWQRIYLVAQAQANTPRAKTFKFSNGQWFDGKKFRRLIFYSVDGVLTLKQPTKVDEVINLQNGYVVPPFGDAHNHYLSSPFNIDKIIHQYLEDGIFYVKNPANIGRDTNLIKSKIDNPQSVDAVFANGPLTASGGHPVELYETGGSLSRVKKPGSDGKFENLAYFIIDDEDDLQKKWGLVMADKPDFIKTGLLYSEEFEKRRNDPAYIGYKGLNPKLLPLIVAKAHEAGLRVACHIETATDFRNALMAGVDEIAHLPGYYPDFSHGLNASSYLITRQDAELAARKSTVVVTTTYVSPAELKKSDKLKQAQDIQKHNLRLLQKAGVKLAIGPDVYSVTSLAEVMNLYALQVFDNLTLLKMWCETTAQSIFPRRRIGRLQPGYEASFVVLRGNPLKNFESVKNIGLRFKQGYILDLLRDKAA